jgi:hypothetical protein
MRSCLENRSTAHGSRHGARLWRWSRSQGTRAVGAALAAGALSLVLLGGCKKDEPRGAPPPPPAVAKPDACAKGGGTLADSASAPFFPRTAAGFCLDPNGGDKAFGEAASLPIDDICNMFDGECEIYKGFGVKRVVEARYVSGAGGSATVDVHLSKFATTEGAYAMFTKRVVGDGDPADESTPRPIEGGGVAALGIGSAYLWRGQHLAEITYNDESVAEAALKAASDKVLPGLVSEMGAKLPGETSMLPAAAALPRDNLLPLGVRYVAKDALDVDGAGAGAFGYYREGEKRYRALVLVRGDADQAKDVFTSFAKLPGASKEKGIGEGAVRLMHKEGESAPTEWIFTRVDRTVYGIGDESRVLRNGMTAEEHAKVTLGKDEKAEKLKKLLAAR